ncbi:MAG: undecaprenyl-diphosphate phosphatase [Hyphomicrobiaceae bacterium]|nr:undecaprenyl-diphosphate phosphatase [Hyphomicrobiaceae bacterium]
MQNYLIAALLGIVEGLTEFLPVSSTAHILLLGHFLGFKSTGRTFEVLIQLGAILAILLVYSGRLFDLARRLPHDPTARRFVVGIAVAFLPAAIIGALFHKYIKAAFEVPIAICIALIIGGIVLLFIDNIRLSPRFRRVEDYPIPMALKIGICQCFAMFPGVSRSGATIVGALLFGADKRSAAEFSFFLAMPTMAGAFAYDLYKNYALLRVDDVATIAIGFVCAFLSALFVVRSFLNFVSRHGFAVFAYWRIVLGSFGLVALLLGA